LLSGDRLNQVRDGLIALAQRYDRVVVDLGAGIETNVRVLAGASGTVLVVATDEPTSITDAYAFIKVTTMQFPGTDVRIVINQALNARDGKRTYETLRKACETFLSLSPPLAGVIRSDPKVKDSIRNQTPMLIRHPTCAAATDVEALARTLLAS
jgi:flagellar biosynthesis protein FlhG